VPGTARRTASIWRATVSNSARSVPKTFTPTGVRMPVDSMSMRARIGIVQALDTPGNCSAASISALRLSTVTPGRHSRFGFRLMIVSNISGRGGIGCGLRPSRLAEDGFHLGKDLMIRSCICMSSAPW
jgi:hypothetical protein